MTNGYHNSYRQVEDVLKEDVVILKIAAYHEGSIRELGERELIPEWKDRVQVCVAGEEWVDFMDRSVDKGNNTRSSVQGKRPCLDSNTRSSVFQRKPWHSGTIPMTSD